MNLKHISQELVAETSVCSHGAHLNHAQFSTLGTRPTKQVLIYLRTSAVERADVECGDRPPSHPPPFTKRYYEDEKSPRGVWGAPLAGGAPLVRCRLGGVPRTLGWAPPRSPRGRPWAGVCCGRGVAWLLSLEQGQEPPSPARGRASSRCSLPLCF